MFAVFYPQNNMTNSNNLSHFISSNKKIFVTFLPLQDFFHLPIFKTIYVYLYYRKYIWISNRNYAHVKHIHKTKEKKITWIRSEETGKTLVSYKRKHITYTYFVCCWMSIHIDIHVCVVVKVFKKVMQSQSFYDPYLLDISIKNE